MSDPEVYPQYSPDRHTLLSLIEQLITPLFSFEEPVVIRKATTSASAEKVSEVHNGEKEFLIHLELHNFQPEEIMIVTDNNQVTITARHDYKQKSHGCISREMKYTYKLSEDIEPQSLASAMNSHGILVITGAKRIEKTLEKH